MVLVHGTVAQIVTSTHLLHGGEEALHQASILCINRRDAVVGHGQVLSAFLLAPRWTKANNLRRVGGEKKIAWKDDMKIQGRGKTIVS